MLQGCLQPRHGELQQGESSLWKGQGWAPQDETGKRPLVEERGHCRPHLKGRWASLGIRKAHIERTI